MDEGWVLVTRQRMLRWLAANMMIVFQKGKLVTLMKDSFPLESLDC